MIIIHDDFVNMDGQYRPYEEFEVTAEKISDQNPILMPKEDKYVIVFEDKGNGQRHTISYGSKEERDREYAKVERYRDRTKGRH